MKLLAVLILFSALLSVSVTTKNIFDPTPQKKKTLDAHETVYCQILLQRTDSKITSTDNILKHSSRITGPAKTKQPNDKKNNLKEIISSLNNYSNYDNYNTEVNEACFSTYRFLHLTTTKQDQKMSQNFLYKVNSKRQSFFTQTKITVTFNSKVTLNSE